MTQFVKWLLHGSDDLGYVKMTRDRLREAEALKDRYCHPDLAYISRGVELDHREFWADVERQRAPRLRRVV